MCFMDIFSENRTSELVKTFFCSLSIDNFSENRMSELVKTFFLVKSCLVSAPKLFLSTDLNLAYS